MSVDVEKILRPVDNPIPPFPPKYMMLAGGEDPKFVARRIIIFASEDVGNADPTALQVAVAAARAVEFVGLEFVEFELLPAEVAAGFEGGDIQRQEVFSFFWEGRIERGDGVLECYNLSFLYERAERDHARHPLVAESGGHLDCRDEDGVEVGAAEVGRLHE